MDELRLPASLERSQRILVAGAGGGFDVYAGLPIYERLRALGKDVFLANLSFSSSVLGRRRRRGCRDAGSPEHRQRQHRVGHRRALRGLSPRAAHPGEQAVHQPPHDPPLGVRPSRGRSANLYLERLALTQSIWDVQLAIEKSHANAQIRAREPIPH
jgi:hypothetical protein